MRRPRFTLSPSFVVACILGAGRIIASGGRDAGAWQEAAAIIGLAASPGVQAHDRDGDGIPDHMQREPRERRREPRTRGVELPPGEGYATPDELRPSSRRGPVLEWE